MSGYCNSLFQIHNSAAVKTYFQRYLISFFLFVVLGSLAKGVLLITFLVSISKLVLKLLVQLLFTSHHHLEEST